MPNINLGVCGGISAYKTAYLASELTKNGYSVKTVMTRGARKFITPLTFETLTGQRVYTDLFKKPYDENHTSLTAWADFAVIAPATATTMARMANGLADTLLSAVILDFKGPVLLCPAMHDAMYDNPATKRNLSLLREYGFHFSGPVSGDLAGGKRGPGRMEEPEKIFQDIKQIIEPGR